MLLCAAFLSRLALSFLAGYLHGSDGWRTPDSQSYLLSAKGLLDGAFASGGRVEIARTPGYPLLLLPGVALEIAPVYAFILNSIISVAIVWLVWKLALTLTGSTTAALAAGILYLIEPIGLIMATKIAPETAFSAMVLAFLLFFHRLLQTGTIRSAILAGTILAASAYVRPASLYLGIFLLPLTLVFPRTAPISRRLLTGVVFQMIFVLLVLPWFLRNYKQARFVGFASISDQALYFYSAASVEARLQNKSFEKMQTEMGWLNWNGYLSRHPEQENWTSGQVAMFQRAEAKRILRENLGLYLPIHFRGCAIMLLDPGATEVLKLLKLYPASGGLLGRVADEGLFRSGLWLVRSHPVSILGLASTGLLLLVIYAGGIVGLVRMGCLAALIYISVASYFIFTSGGPMAVARYRQPILPLFCVAAGAGIGAIRQRFSLSKKTLCR